MGAFNSLTMSDLNIATEMYTKELVRVVTSDNVISSRWLGKSESVDGGAKIAVPLRYGKENVSIVANEYTARGDSSSTTMLNQAGFDWTFINGEVTLSQKEKDVVNRGKRAELNLVKTKTMNLADTFKDEMSDMLFADTIATGGIDSLHKICATQANVVGGIDSDSAVYGGTNGSGTFQFDWNPVVQRQYGAYATGTTEGAYNDTTSLATFTQLTDPTDQNYILKIMREIAGELTIGSDKPTLFLTTQVVWDAYEQVLSDLKRFGASSSSKADGGFDILKFRNVDVAVDNHVQGGKYDPNTGASDGAYLYALNEDFIGMYHSTNVNFKVTPWAKLENQHIYRSDLAWYGGVGVSRRDMQGAVTGLPTSY
jgi:hypothetical protein